VVERAKTARPASGYAGVAGDQNDWADTLFPTHAAAVPFRAQQSCVSHAGRCDTRAREREGARAGTGSPPQRPTRLAAGSFVILAIIRQEYWSTTHRALGSSHPGELAGGAARADARGDCRGESLGSDGQSRRGLGPRRHRRLRGIGEEGRYSLRNYVMVRSSDSVLDGSCSAGRRKRLYDGRLWIRCDQARGRWRAGEQRRRRLLSLQRRSGNTGLITTPPERSGAWRCGALKAGFRSTSMRSAIGRIASCSISSKRRCARVRPPITGFRIEHAQILRYQDIPRFAELDVDPLHAGQSSDE